MSENTSDVIIIGAGVAGLSAAMQLAKRGVSVRVLEREQIGNGSTGRAAGLLGQLRGTSEHTRMLMDGVKIVKELEEQADVEIYVQTGSVRVAETPERAQELADLIRMGQSIGFDISDIPIPELAERMPYMRTDDLIEACWCPTDGHLQPSELAVAYHKVGKAHGVDYQTNCPVTGVLLDGGKVTGVQTSQGDFHAPIIVNAAGPWSYLIADLAGTILPTAALGHVYLTTQPDPDHPVDRLSPGFRNRHHRIYGRPENGGLLVGMYGEDCPEYDMDTLPVDFDMSAMKARLDDIHLAMLIHSAQQRFPWLNERTPMHVTTGIMTFTPDGRPFCGQLPDHEGLYHCTGFSGHGIVQSPVIGVIMSELILEGKSSYDIESIEADRYWDVPGFQDRAEIKERCYKMQGSYYGRVEGEISETS
jgi:4-methylaminobutanoate oxidase (formaldehyde-forming)